MRLMTIKFDKIEYASIVDKDGLIGFQHDDATCAHISK